MLAETPSRSKIRTISWDKIEKTADNYLKKTSETIPKLQKEVEDLKVKIAEAEQGEAPVFLDESAITGMLTKAFATDTTFKSLEIAKTVKCGAAGVKIRRQHKVSIQAFTNTLEVFDTVLEETFSPATVRTTAESVRQVCMGMLFDPQEAAAAMENGDNDNDCDELCTQMSSNAQDSSDSYAGVKVGVSAAALRDQLQALLAKLSYEESEKSECERAKDALKAFAEQLKAFSKNVKVTFNLRLAAKNKYEEALEEMDELEEKEGDISAQADEAKRQLEASAKEAEGATEAVLKMKKASKEAATEAEKAKKAAELAFDALEKATNAYAAVEEIKALVSQTMMQMQGYFDAAVAKPVERLGLHLNTDLKQYFDRVTGELSEKKDVDSTVLTMDRYCKTTALKAFERVKNTVDLTPLCEFGEVADITTAIDRMVTARRDDVRGSLEQVQAVITPYRGTQITDKELQKRLSEGEPLGLREVMTVYGDTGYYRNYLKHWKSNTQGSYVTLCKDLYSKVAALETHKQNMIKANDEMQKALAKANQDVKEAQAKLKQALSTKSIDQQKKQALDLELQKQEEAISAQQSMLDELLRKLKAAEQAYAEAQKALTAAHAEGTSMQLL